MNSSVMNTYNRYPVSFKDGNGAWLTSEDNRQFLDFSSGIAVNILGHNHPEINKTFEMYANKKWYLIKPFKQSGDLDVTILKKLMLKI